MTREKFGDHERMTPGEKISRLEEIRGRIGSQLKEGFCDYLLNSSTMEEGEFIDEVSSWSDEQIYASIDTRLRKLHHENKNTSSE